MQYNEVMVEKKEDKVTLKQEQKKSPYFISLEDELGKGKEMKSNDCDRIFLTVGVNNDGLSHLDKKR